MQPQMANSLLELDRGQQLMAPHLHTHAHIHTSFHTSKVTGQRIRRKRASVCSIRVRCTACSALLGGPSSSSSGTPPGSFRLLRSCCTNKDPSAATLASSDTSSIRSWTCVIAVAQQIARPARVPFLLAKDASVSMSGRPCL